MLVKLHISEKNKQLIDDYGSGMKCKGGGKTQKRGKLYLGVTGSKSNCKRRLTRRTGTATCSLQTGLSMEVDRNGDEAFIWPYIFLHS